MIESISISGVATYGDTAELLEGLSHFNFIYGSNGTGKTTIGRIIADESTFPTCQVTWRTGQKLRALVYNNDFVERNFNQSTHLKGVFTLGEKQVDILAQITFAKEELDAITAKVVNLRRNLQGDDGKGGKKGELASIEVGFKARCWLQKQKHDAKLQGGFEGFRNSAERFKNKVLEESISNAASLLTLDELEKKAENLFADSPAVETFTPTVDTTKLLELEATPILRKQVIGRDTVDIAAMVKKLENSDWIRVGLDFYHVNNGVCPFCQQKTSDAFAQSLRDFFDDVFVQDTRLIDNLIEDYRTEASRIQQLIETIIASPSRFLDVEKLKVEKDLLDAKILINNQRLAGKKKEASQLVKLDSLSNICAVLKGLVDDSNMDVAAHNKMVANLRTERINLTAQIWRFILEELKPELSKFKASRDGLEKAITAMTARIEEATAEMLKKEAEISELEKQSNSIQPTVDGVNGLLSSFGFQGFRLSTVASGTSYQLIRSDGSEAMATLSEGEKTFVTFLYFYYLLKGSETETGMTTDRIVVFDDPVSSLDSDILFIVGSLIKQLFSEVRAGVGHIKQIFVLTHNVYFHKEVTYPPTQKGVPLSERTYWIVRKPGLISRLEKHQSNPIKTSYELLWAEVRKQEHSNPAIQNTLRRILENYFKILGRMNFDDLCAKFEGNERYICKSLCSWVNDGSHNAHDDLYVSINETMVASYLRVFKSIFDKMDHGAHYKMMMADAFVDVAT